MQVPVMDCGNGEKVLTDTKDILIKICDYYPEDKLLPKEDKAGQEMEDFLEHVIFLYRYTIDRWTYLS